MEQNKLYEERNSRIRKAIAMEPVDKIPVAPCGNAYWAKQQGVKLSEYLTDFELACTTNIEAMEALGGVDATQNTIFSPYLLPTQWLSEVHVPGKELDDNEMWQVVEKGIVTDEDYDDILANGFTPFYEDCLKNRLNDNNANLVPYFEYLPTANKRFKDAGIPCICDFLMVTPFEFFCGGRTLETFFVEDLFGQPDKIDKVFEKVMEYTMPHYRNMIKSGAGSSVWIGGWRTAPSMMSEDMFDRFVWPYFKAYTDLCVELDVLPMFHLDANWDRALPKFLEMPAQKCVLALDSVTDIRLARKVLGDHMCILGDVPASMLAFGKPEEVRKYVTDVLDDIGSTGIIIASGCDIPSNGKRENIQAMVDAANDYLG